MYRAEDYRENLFKKRADYYVTHTDIMKNDVLKKNDKSLVLIPGGKTHNFTTTIQILPLFTCFASINQCDC